MFHELSLEWPRRPREMMLISNGSRNKRKYLSSSNTFVIIAHKFVSAQGLQRCKNAMAKSLYHLTEKVLFIQTVLMAERKDFLILISRVSFELFEWLT